VESVCTEENDLVNCCEPAPECHPDKILDFSNAAVLNNNLGGKGPGNGVQDILYAGVTKDDSGREINVRVTANSPYTPQNVAKNGIRGHYGQVNVKQGTSVDLTFSFETVNGESFLMKHPFFFSIFDADENQNNATREITETSGFLEYKTTDNTEVEVMTSAGKTRFSSTTFGTIQDNPKNPLALTLQQKARSVTFKFPAAQSFDMTFTAAKGFSGRNFMFTGPSLLVCPLKSQEEWNKKR